MICNLQLLFCMQNCRSRIVQVQYQGQARDNGIIESKHLIDTSFRTLHRTELKHFLSSSSSLTSEKWELITWNFGHISSYGWLVSSTVAWDDCFTKINCSKNLRIKNQSFSFQRWSLHGFQTSHFRSSFATDLPANFGYYWFRITPGGVTLFPSFCNAMSAAIWSSCAVLFESEPTVGRPFLRQVVEFMVISALLHRIRLGTCVFVPMSYFYSETNEWLQNWVKQWALLWSATTSPQFHRKFHFTLKKKWLVAARHLKKLKPFGL